ncbi:unnamed protein product [Phaedon cochleariae]|uniref:Zinc finger PHD-type domain-containing protein n=1 Tax=Phaedon cochleariae TaxID=80249 RepID=A0A9N9X2Q3_PHACE|nr:unnamed protein product [Phaedon cochleariae]
MAPSEVSTDDEAEKNAKTCNTEFTSACKKCSRDTKSKVYCVECGALYHPACAVWEKGLKVMGNNLLMCSECYVASKPADMEEYQIVVNKNQELENTDEVHQLLARIQLYSEENTWLHDKISILETRIIDLEENAEENSATDVIHEILGKIGIIESKLDNSCFYTWYKKTVLCRSSKT